VVAWYFIHTTMSRAMLKNEDPEYDELAEDQDDEEEAEYEEEEGFYIESAIKPPNSHPVSCYDLYNQIQEGMCFSYVFLCLKKVRNA
jgi:hypothetical protein